MAEDFPDHVTMRCITKFERSLGAVVGVNVL